MTRVIIESPYSGDVKRNVKYARMCLLDSLNRGEAPIASHLLYTQVLDDTIPEQRTIGINAGLEWLKLAEKHVFYIDHGYSEGMLYAFGLSLRSGIEIEERKILK